jgi:hypothetical protein
MFGAIEDDQPTNAASPALGPRPHARANPHTHSQRRPKRAWIHGAAYVAATATIGTTTVQASRTPRASGSPQWLAAGVAAVAVPSEKAATDGDPRQARQQRRLQGVGPGCAQRGQGAVHDDKQEAEQGEGGGLEAGVRRPKREHEGQRLTVGHHMGRQAQTIQPQQAAMCA